MHRVVNEPINVYFLSEPGRSVRPLYLKWQQHTYRVEQLSHTFTVPRGLGKCHIYCLVAEGTYFEVLLDPDVMVFTLREVHDGRAD